MIGALNAFATLSLIQDIIGRDEYLNLARDYWIDGAITIPIAIITIIGANVALWRISNAND